MSPTLFGTLDPFLESGPVLGRKVANQGFLTALLQADPFDEYHFFPADRRFAESYQAELERSFPGIKAVVRHRMELPRALAENDFHCFHLSDCILNFAHLGRLRNRVSKRTFPITAPVHSLSYASYGQAMSLHLWPGATPRDCVVATSRAGEASVRAFYDTLRQRLGLDPAGFPGPSVRRIPLGVDPGLFPEPTEANKAQARERAGLSPDKATILVFGRIHHASKMDVLPLVRAAWRASAQGRLDLGAVRLVLAGWMDDKDELPASLAALAKGRGLETIIKARPDDQEKADLFLGADCFVSLADNPQETFGLSILEAMLAGLPVIASDYDGYRDTVVHQETGLLIPSLGPAETPDVDVLAPLLFDNQYHLLLAQQTAVSVGRTADALARLLGGSEESENLRRAMGQAGRKRVLERFTWGSVVEQHVALWEELNKLDAGDRERLADIPHPQHVDYGRTFAAHPTGLLDPDMRVRMGSAGQDVHQGREDPARYLGVAWLLDKEALRHACFLARKSVTVAELARRLGERFPAYANPDWARFLILWCLKHDLLELEEWGAGDE